MILGIPLSSSTAYTMIIHSLKRGNFFNKGKTKFDTPFIEFYCWNPIGETGEMKTQNLHYNKKQFSFISLFCNLVEIFFAI